MAFRKQISGKGFLCLILSLALAAPLAGCQIPPSLPSAEVSTAAWEDLNRKVRRCADEWINTVAAIEDIHSGLAEGILVLNAETGRYGFAQEDQDAFEWIKNSGLPWSNIEHQALHHGNCLYISLTPEEESAHESQERAINDCLDAWTNNQPPHVIESGVHWEVITTDSVTGRHHASPDAEPFVMWRSENNVPWIDIRFAVIYGEGCPF